MSALTDFQKEYGQAWAEITNSPAFSAAMLLLNMEKINAIAAMTPEDIKAKGELVLADFVGHLNHENGLATLAARTEFVFTEVRESYPEPIEEHAAELRGDMTPPDEPTPPRVPPKHRKKK